MKNKLKIKLAIIVLVTVLIIAVNTFSALSMDTTTYMVLLFTSAIALITSIYIIWKWDGIEEKKELVTGFKMLVAMPGTAEREVLVHRNITHIKGITQSMVLNTGEIIPVPSTIEHYYIKLLKYSQRTGMAEFRLELPVRESYLPAAILSASAVDEGTDGRMELVYRS